MRKISTTEIASIALLVLRACREGDPVARELVREAARELFLGVRAVMGRLELIPGGTKVSLLGGLMGDGSPLRAELEAMLAEGMPGIRVVKPVLPPVLGALLMALEAGGIGVDEGIVERMASSWKRIGRG